MSAAVRLTDTKDLAVDPATTVEDTQHTRESIISYTNSLLLRVSYTICPRLLYLTCLSVALPSPLSYTFLIYAFSVNKDAIFIWLLLPKTLS